MARSDDDQLVFISAFANNHHYSNTLISDKEETLETQTNEGRTSIMGNPFTADAIRLGRAIEELTERNATLEAQLASMDRALHIAQTEIEAKDQTHRSEVEMLRSAVDSANNKADYYSRYAIRVHTLFTALSHDALLINKRIHDVIDTAKAEAFAPRLANEVSGSEGETKPASGEGEPDEPHQREIVRTNIGAGAGAEDDGKPAPRFLMTSLESHLRQVNLRGKSR